VIAIGSIAECETQLEIARRLNFATDTALTAPAAVGEPLRRVVFGLRRSLRRKLQNKSGVRGEQP
jgi:hypothetical protein